MILHLIEFFLYLLVFTAPGIALGWLISERIRRGAVSFLFASLISAIGFATVFGFALLRFDQFSPTVIRGAYVVIAAVVLVIALRKLIRSHQTLRRGPVLLALLCFGLLFSSYLIYQNAQYPRGGDANEHFVKIEQILAQRQIPPTELGLNSPTYYPRGFHVAIAVFQEMNRNLPLWEVFKYFSALLFAVTIFAVYFFTTFVFRHREIALLALLVGLAYSANFLLRSNLPMLLSCFYIVLLLCIIAARLDEAPGPRREIIPFGILLAALITTHPVMVEYFLFAVAAVFFAFLLSAPKKWKNGLTTGLILAAVILLALGFYYAANRTLLEGQLSYTTNKIEVHDEVLGAVSRLTSFTFTKGVPNFLLLYLTPLLAFPFVYGALSLLRLKRVSSALLALLVLAILACSTSILLLGRYQYVLLFPVVSISAFGLWRLGLWLNHNDQGVTRFVHGMLVFGLLFFSVIQLLFLVQYPLLGSTIPAISSDSYALVSEVQKYGLEHRTIAAIRSPSILLLEALTTNKILGGDARYIDNPVYKDIAELYSPDTTSERMSQIIRTYAIDAILLNSAPEQKSAFLDKVRSTQTIERELPLSGSKELIVITPL